MKALVRALLSVYFVFHGLTMSVSACRDTPYGERLHPLTDPWQWTVGMHQNWEMFVPDPRRSTTWLDMQGIRQDGTRVPLALPYREGDPDGTILRYDRGGKLVRNAVGDRKHVRAGLVRWTCRGHEELARVAFARVAVPTPPPGRRAEAPRSAWPSRRSDLETWRCKR